jgi:hypothetical protein
MTTNDLQLIKEMYLQGCSMAEIGRTFKYDGSTIKKYLLQMNVPLRTKAEQNTITNMKRAKSVDHTYFSQIDTVNKAWLLGFLAADGSITRNRNAIKLSLSSVDLEILEKIKKELKIERNIMTSISSNGFEISSLEWSSLQHKQDLARYGIVNNKTYLPMKLPEFKDDDLKLAFILGFFDGDGSISTHNGYLRFRICSHRPEILESFAEFFFNAYDITYSLNQDSRGLYELSISTTYCLKIFQDMYNLNSLRLNRKYKKYLEYINHETETSSHEDEKIC